MENVAGESVLMENPKKKRRSRRFFAWAFLIPCIVVLVSLVVFPLIYSLYYSFHAYDLTAPFLGTPFVGGQNYIDLVLEPRFWVGVRNTFYYAGGATAAEILIGLGIALLLNVITRGRTAFISILLIPVMLAPVIVGQIWLLLFNVPYGWFNYLFLTVFNVALPSWLSSPFYGGTKP